jgi:hypothetical protein
MWRPHAAGPLSSDGRALQIGSDDQGARIGRFEFGDGSIQIEYSDMTDDQSSGSSLLGDVPHYGRGSMKSIGCGTGADRKMHDQHVGLLGEIDEFRIRAGLVGTETIEPSRVSTR